MLAFLLAAGMLDGAHIVNSGSTNTPAYEIRIWSDGHARVTTKGNTNNVRIDPGVARQFFADAKKAKAENATGAACMKSASFGSKTTVLYHGWRSPDVTCPLTGTLAALASDVAVISQALDPVRPRRIQLPPNEPRRFPDEKPTPTPRPS